MHLAKPINLQEYPILIGAFNSQNFAVPAATGMPRERRVTRLLTFSTAATLAACAASWASAQPVLLAGTTPAALSPPLSAPSRSISMPGDGLYRAAMIQSLGAPALGEAPMRAALAAYQRDLSTHHPQTLACTLSLADLLRWANNAEASLTVLDELLPKMRAAYGDKSSELISLKNRRALALAGLKRYDDAASELAQVGALWGVTLAPSGRASGSQTALDKLQDMQAAISRHLSLTRSATDQDAMASMAFAAELAFARFDPSLAPTVERASAAHEALFQVLEKNPATSVAPALRVNLFAVGERWVALREMVAEEGSNYSGATPAERTYRALSKHYGSTQPLTLLALYQWSGQQRTSAQTKAIRPTLEATLGGVVATLGAAHPDALVTRALIAYTFAGEQRLDLALPLLQENLSRLREGGERYGLTALPLMHNALNVSYAQAAVADTLQAMGKTDEAFSQRVAQLAALRADPDPQTRLAAEVAEQLAWAYERANQKTKAAETREQLLRQYVLIRGSDDAETISYRTRIANNYNATGNVSRAIELELETLATLRRSRGETHADTTFCMSRIAALYNKSEKLDLALPYYVKLAEAVKSTNGAESPALIDPAETVARTYAKLGQPASAVPWQEQAAAAMKKTQGANHWSTLEIEKRLAKLYEEAGQSDKSKLLLTDIEKRSREKTEREATTIIIRGK